MKITVERSGKPWKKPNCPFSDYGNSKMKFNINYIENTFKKVFKPRERDEYPGTDHKNSK